MMEKISARKVDVDIIELSSAKDIDRLYDLIDKDENFILEWEDGEELRSELQIANNITGKVKTGEIKITSREAKNAN